MSPGREQPTPPPPLAALLAEPLARALAEACDDVPCHLVGGALRDRLLGRPAADLDAVVARSGERIAGALAARSGTRVIRLGADRFASFRLLLPQGTLDLWDRQGARLAVDLARRDLTVNAMALDLATARFLDPHGGRDDLRDRCLRATNPDVFAADPLRVLRLARFAAALDGFSCHPDTLHRARAAAPALPAVAPERVREELRRLLTWRHAAPALQVLCATGVYPALWSGTLEAGAQPIPPPTAIPVLDRRLERLRTLTLPGGSTDPESARHGLLFALLTEPRGEPIEARIQRFAANGYVSRRAARRIGTVLGCPRPGPTDADLRRFLHAAGELWPTAAVVAATDPRDGLDETAWQDRLEALTRLAEEEGERLFGARALLDGHDVRRILGLADGPAIGRVLAALRAAEIDGEVTSRQEAIAWVRRVAGSGE